MISYPLTQTQLGIYLDCISHPQHQLYHIPLLLKMPEGTDAERLASAVDTVFKAHPAFSARIAQDESGAPTWRACDIAVKVESLTMAEDLLHGDALFSAS